jgi:transposase
MIRYYFVGIDIAARYFDVCLSLNRALHTKRFEQSLAGFEALSDWLAAQGAARCWTAMEHTGGYERSLAEFLLAKGHRVSLVDPFRVKRFKESLGKKAKTDRGCSIALCRYARERRPAQWTPRPDAFADLLELTRHRQNLVDSMVSWKNRRSSPKRNEFVHDQQDAAIQVLEVMIKEAGAEIRECIAGDAEISRCVARIDSLTAIDVTTAANFLAESGPITRSTYPTPESLSLEGGLCPLPWMSGVSVRGTYSKPYGNERLRNCLNLAAPNAKRWDPAIAAFAKRLEQRGKSKSVQNRAIKRKLVHIIWGLVINDQDYDPQKAFMRQT